MTAMGLRLALVLLLVGLHGVSSADSPVIELTSADVDQLQEGTWLVEFYAPWCGYCKRFEPVYEEVAQELAITSVKVARIDSHKYESTGFRFGVQGFPTIFHVHEKAVRRYSGSREKGDLIKFATETYKNHDPETSGPMGISPFSTGAKAISIFIDYVLALKTGFEFVREKTGLSQPIVLGIFALLAVLIGSILGLILATMMPAAKPAAKPPAPPPQAAVAKQD